jgi:hypothetical protein
VRITAVTFCDGREALKDKIFFNICFLSGKSDSGYSHYIKFSYREKSVKKSLKRGLGNELHYRHSL